MASQTLFLASLALLGSVNEPCGDRVAHSNFTLDAYLGTWYEMYRYPNAFQRDSECVTTEVYVETNEVDMRMYHTMVVLEPEFRILDSTMYGRFAFPGAIPALGAFNISYVGVYDRTNFLILDTDYTDYSVAWSCLDNGDRETSEQMAWIFSRYNYIRSDAGDKVLERINALLHRDLLRETISDDNTCLGGEISPAK